MEADAEPVRHAWRFRRDRAEWPVGHRRVALARPWPALSPPHAHVHLAVHETKSSTAIERALSSAGIRVTTRLTSHVPRPGHFVVYVRAKQRRRACERDVRGRIGVIG